MAYIFLKRNDTKNGNEKKKNLGDVQCVLLHKTNIHTTFMLLLLDDNNLFFTLNYDRK